MSFVETKSEGAEKLFLKLISEIRREKEIRAPASDAIKREKEAARKKKVPRNDITDVTTRFAVWHRLKVTIRPPWCEWNNIRWLRNRKKTERKQIARAMDNTRQTLDVSADTMYTQRIIIYPRRVDLIDQSSRFSILECVYPVKSDNDGGRKNNSLWTEWDRNGGTGLSDTRAQFYRN